jgi:hypothetical protein
VIFITQSCLGNVPLSYWRVVPILYHMKCPQSEGFFHFFVLPRHKPTKGRTLLSATDCMRDLQCRSNVVISPKKQTVSSQRTAIKVDTNCSAKNGNTRWTHHLLMGSRRRRRHTSSPRTKPPFFDSLPNTIFDVVIP